NQVLHTTYNYSSYNVNTPPNVRSEEALGDETPVESSIVYQNADGTIAKTVTKAFASVGSRLACWTETLNDGATTSGTWLVYDPSYRMVTNEKEYDYGMVTSGDCASPGTLHTPPSVTATRETV